MSKPTKPSRYDKFLSREQAQDQFRVEQMKEQKARQENTARLRALRLAKEAAERAAAEAAPKKPVVARKASAASRLGKGK